MFLFSVDGKLYHIKSDDQRNTIMEMLNEIDMHFVNENYFTFEGEVFDGEIKTNIGLHFRGKALYKIELFDGGEMYQNGKIVERFYLKEKILDSIYDEGIKHESEPIYINIDGEDVKHIFNNAYYEEEGYQIEHYMIDRFGPEEHLHIVKPYIGVPLKEMSKRDMIPFLIFLLVLFVGIIGVIYLVLFRGIIIIF